LEPLLANNPVEISAITEIRVYCRPIDDACGTFDAQ
jgi:hypothetical protein